MRVARFFPGTWGRAWMSHSKGTALLPTGAVFWLLAYIRAPVANWACWEPESPLAVCSAGRGPRGA